MFKQSVKKKLSIMLGLSMTLAALTGCGKTADDSEIQDALNSNRTQEARENDEQSEKLQDTHVNYTVDSKDGSSSITVDADVKPCNSKQIAIYGIKKHQMDDAYIKDLADRVFDNGTYTYQKPLAICSKAELDQEREWVDETGKYYDDKKTSYPFPFLDEVHNLEFYEEYFKEENVQEMPEGQYYYTCDLSSNLNDYGIVQMSDCKFTGTIDGEEWVLTSTLYGDYQTATLYPRYQKETLTNVIDGDIYATGVSTMDQKQGEEQAENKIKDLGYVDYELVNTTATLTLSGTNTSDMNGFVYTFARTFNDVKTAYLARFNPAIYIKDYRNTPQEYITVYVDQYGVEKIDFLSNYELGDVLTQSPNLLDFSSIDEIAKEQIVKGMEGVSVQKFTIDRIEMCYMAVKDKNSKYSYIPVWDYHLNYGNGDSERYTTDICINAVDGTVINDRVTFNYTFNIEKENKN